MECVRNDESGITVQQYQLERVQRIAAFLDYIERRNAANIERLLHKSVKTLM